MVIYYKNILCVSFDELVDKSTKKCEVGNGIITYNQYCNYIRTNPNTNSTKLKIVRKPSRGHCALYDYELLPEKIKSALKKRYPQGVHQAAEHNYLEKFYSYDEQAYDYYDGQGLTDKQVRRYTNNANVVQAVIRCLNDRTAYQNSLGNPRGRRGINYEQIMDDLKAKRMVWGHTYKSERTLRRAINRFKNEGYAGLISGKIGNQNSAKVKEPLQQAALRRLMSDFRNLDDQQVADMYNTAFPEESITRQTVANYRQKWQIYTDAGSRGERHHDNIHGMQVRRKRASFPMAMWVLDGWDVELFYQKTETDKKGNTRTTYTNRLTLEMVIDAMNDYPVGYVIADTESGEVIKSALRDAVRHTKELFGCYYHPHQVQMDNFGKKSVMGFYEALTKHVVPAKVGNAKSKVIEPFFKKLNKICQFQPNWSGFGATARKENQPNGEYLNKTIVKHNFPDREGAIRQLESIINTLRAQAIEEYREKWEEVHSDNKLPWNTVQYLHQLGETTGYTNKLEGSGLHVTLGGMKRVYDSFDMDFRVRHRTQDWIIKYDPAETDMVLAENEEGSARYLLREKEELPMALVDRQEGDSVKLQSIYDYNKELKAHVMDVQAEDIELLQSAKELEVLNKFLMTDSLGQHKINKAKARIAAATSEMTQKEVKRQEEQQQAASKTLLQKRMDFINERYGAEIDDLVNNY